MIIPAETLALFAVAATLTILSPGPDTINVMRQGLSNGRGAGLIAVLGVQCGLLVHTALAVFGISALIASSPAALQAVAIAGAAYLAWIGIQGFRGTGVIRIDTQGTSASSWRAFRDAALVNLLNPKVIVLFLALYPNFIDATRDDVSAQLMVLSAVMIVINGAWQSGLVLAVASVRKWLANARIARAINWGTGTVLIGFAVLLLLDHAL